MFFLFYSRGIIVYIILGIAKDINLVSWKKYSRIGQTWQNQEYFSCFIKEIFLLGPLWVMSIMHLLIYLSNNILGVYKILGILNNAKLFA